MYYPECQIRSTRLVILVLVVSIGLLFSGCGRSTEKFLAKGEEYLAKRKFHDAQMQFRSAVESDRDSGRAHWGLARAYENLGQFNEAFDELRKAAELDKDNLDAQAKLGNYFLLMKPAMISEAEKTQEFIVARDPRFVEGTILKASILAARSRPDSEVVGKINEAIAIDPTRTETYISLSRYYVTREIFDKAEEAIKTGIAANPASAVGMTEYGRFLMYAKRDVEADAQFTKAIETEPANIEARESQADFYVTSEQLDKAENAYKKLVEIQENSPESKLELADFYSGIRRPADALAILEQIVNESPEYVRARYRLGQLYLEQKDDAKVEEQLAALFEKNNEDVEALMLRSRLRLYQSKPDEAVKDLEDILKRQPSNRDALYYISQAKIAAGQIDQAKAFIGDIERYHPNFLKVGLLKIQAAFAAGEFDGALKAANDTYTAASSAMPNADLGVLAIQDLQIRSLSARGLAYLELGKSKEAQADLERVLMLTPNSSGAMVNLAKVYRVQQNYDGAGQLYEKAIAADPRNFDAAIGIISLNIETKQTQKAHAKIEELTIANAGRADVLAALSYLNSQVYAAESNSNAAESELKRAIELDGDYLPAYSAYAAMLAERNQVAEAIAQYQKVIEKRPSATVFTMVGMLEDSRGNTVDAEKYYRLALEFTPDSPIAANNLAWLIVENEGNLDEALRLATLAVSKNQTVAGYYDTLGWVYLKKNLFPMAAQQFRRAIELDEKSGKEANPGYRVRLGMALASAGDRASARREAEVSLRNANGLTQQEVAQARQVLAAQ